MELQALDMCDELLNVTFPQGHLVWSMEYHKAHFFAPINVILIFKANYVNCFLLAQWCHY